MFEFINIFSDFSVYRPAFNWTRAGLKGCLSDGKGIYRLKLPLHEHYLIPQATIRLFLFSVFSHSTR